MSKYGNKNNENFSNSKYFQQNAPAQKNVLKKNIDPLPYTSPKYSLQQTSISNIYAKPVNNIAKNYSQKLTSQTSKDKYAVPDTMIAKRSAKISKANFSSLWKFIRDIFGTTKLSDEQLYFLRELNRPAAEALEAAEKASAGAVNPKLTQPVTATSPKTDENLWDWLSGGEKPSGAPVVTKPNLPQPAIMSPQDYTKIRNANLDEFNRLYPSHDDSILPHMTPRELSQSNQNAFDYLMEERRKKIKSGGTGTIDETLSMEEAKSLMDKFGVIKPVPPVVVKPKTVIEPEKPKTFTTAARKEETELYGMTREEGLFLDKLQRKGEGILRDNRALENFFKVAREYGYSPRDIATARSLSDDDLIEMMYEVSGKISDRRTMSVSEIKRLEAEKTKPVVQSKPKEPSAAEDLFDYGDETTKAPESYDPFDDETITSTGYPNVTERMVFDKPWRRGSGTKVESKVESIAKPLELDTTITNPSRLLGGYVSPDVPKQKTPKTPKTKMKPLNNWQRAAIIGTAGLAGKYLYDQANKPKTFVPETIPATGKYKVFSFPSDTVSVNPNSPLPDWTAPEIKSMGMYMRPLKQGPVGSNSFVTDKAGNYNVVYSPGQPLIVNGVKRPLTPREKEEQWRFGTDEYEIPTKENKYKTNWYGKWKPIIE